MNNFLLNQVKTSKSWKKSKEYCAKKLNISLEEYNKYLEHIKNSNSFFKSEQKIDLDKGVSEIKKVVYTEPKSAEEIVELLKIDTSEWKLSSYWNKEQNDGSWIVSALVTKINKQSETNIFKNVLENFNPDYTPIKDIHLNKKFTNKSCAVISVQDLHFGKEGNSDVDYDFKKALQDLVYRAYHSHHIDEIMYVIGGDLLNMDTFNGTTTKGTPVHNDGSSVSTYNKAFDNMYWSVSFLKQFCKKLNVVYVPGNHDRLSSYHLVHALGKCFQKEQNIDFHIDYSERKVLVFGANMFAFEHGDVQSKDTPLVYAVEFPMEWGTSVYRTLYTGHYHKNKKVEYITENERNGFIMRTLPSLSKSDYWHYHNKYTGNVRAAILEVHDYFKGKVSEFVHNA